MICAEIDDSPIYDQLFIQSPKQLHVALNGYSRGLAYAELSDLR
jgi:hypothetical protein